MQIKLDKATFQLLIGILTAASTFATTLIQIYIHDPTLATTLGLFIGTVITQVIIWLRAEEPSNGNLPSTTALTTGVSGNFFYQTALAYQNQTTLAWVPAGMWGSSQTAGGEICDTCSTSQDSLT